MIYFNNRFLGYPADYGKRPVSGLEDFLVTGLRFPKNPTKKFFDTTYKAGQTAEQIIKPLSEPTPIDNSEAFLNLLKKAAHKLANLDANKVGQTLGRYADATGSQGGFRNAQK